MLGKLSSLEAVVEKIRVPRDRQLRSDAVCPGLQDQAMGSCLELRSYEAITGYLEGYEDIAMAEAAATHSRNGDLYDIVRQGSA